MDGGIPYFTLPNIELGPITLQAFGILVATGVLFGAYVGRLRAERIGLDEDKLRIMVGWGVGLGFVGAHVFDVLAYQMDALADDPLLLFKFWKGISSYGGFLGGFIGFYIFTRRHEVEVWKYADTFMWGLVPGFTFGRLGCTIVHDHIGAPSDGFFLATNYTAEVIRQHRLGGLGGALEPGLHHNLGMYEFLYMVMLCLIVWAVDRNGRANLRPGFLVLFMAMLYAPVRFVLDFYRYENTDPRYLGLTFAQWMSVVVVVTCAWGLLYIMRKQRDDELPTATAVAGTGGESSGGKSSSKSGGKSSSKSGGKSSSKSGGSGSKKSKGKKRSKGK